MNRFFKIDCQMTFPDEKRRALPFSFLFNMFYSNVYIQNFLRWEENTALTSIQQPFYVLLCAMIPWTEKIFGDIQRCPGGAYSSLWGPGQNVVVGQIIKASDL